MSAHLKCLHGPEPNTAEKLQLPHYEQGILAPYREKDLFLSSHPSADVTHKPPFSKLALISTEQFMSQKKRLLQPVRATLWHHSAQRGVIFYQWHVSQGRADLPTGLGELKAHLVWPSELLVWGLN